MAAIATQGTTQSHARFGGTGNPPALAAERESVARLRAENHRLRDQLQSLEAALRDAARTSDALTALAYRDSLTGLPNRRWLDDAVEEMLSTRRAQEQLALLFVDVDDFKRVNDSVGHCLADELLCQFAHALAQTIRSDDILSLSLRAQAAASNVSRPMLSRLGGDEFVILLPKVRHRHAARSVAHRIVRRLARPFRIDRHDVLVTASIGIAICPSDGKTTDVLINNADAAMYRAKRNGKARYECHSRSTALE